MDVKGLGSSVSEAELRELSKGFGSLIPKKGGNLEEEAFLYGASISILVATTYLMKEI